MPQDRKYKTKGSDYRPGRGRMRGKIKPNVTNVVKALKRKTMGGKLQAQHIKEEILK